MPPDSAVGFASSDWALFLLTAIFLLSILAWRPGAQLAYSSLANNPRLCFFLLFVTPIFLRLLLLPHHPIPTPDSCDEFNHLLMADTLLHGRLANPPHPMHRFFETLFVAQHAPGQGMILALGRLLSGIPWAGVLIAEGAFCATCYWMLRGWVTPNWALLGGILAVIQFGPLCQWTNSYSGGLLTATGGCLVFGALPRLRLYGRRRDAVLLGAGFAIHLITREFESVLLLISVAPFFIRREFKVFRVLTFALVAVLPAVLLILFQNKAVTQTWTTFPPQMTIDPSPSIHQPVVTSTGAFLLRLDYQVRYYRFFFLPPLYLALFAYFFALRDGRLKWLAATLAIFALGTNLFPYFQVHYIAAVTCLFILASVVGLQQLSRLRVSGVSVGVEIARLLVVLCLAEFSSWYMLHLFDSPEFYGVLRYETWDSINHDNPQGRIAINRQLAAINGPLLVFVSYSQHHILQNEWVWNQADIDSSRIVYARDLGPAEDEKLIRYYPERKVLMLHPDTNVTQLSDYPGGT